MNHRHDAAIRAGVTLGEIVNLDAHETQDALDATKLQEEPDFRPQMNTDKRRWEIRKKSRIYLCSSVFICGSIVFSLGFPREILDLQRFQLFRQRIVFRVQHLSPGRVLELLGIGKSRLALRQCDLRLVNLLL
jgi:hypothetical protein